MVEAALEFLNCCSITQWDFTEQKPIDQTMDKWKSAITIWKAGKAQLESKRAAVNHVCWCSGLQNWDWRKRRCVQVTNFEWNWLDLIGCRTDVCCDGWTALHRRGFSAKLRENVANFPAMEPVLLGAGFEIPREPSSKQNSNRNSWKGEKVYWTAFSGGSGCVRKKKTMKLYQGGVKESATAISWSNQNSFTRAVTQKNSNRITYKSEISF
jgi:hypothetical protein